ncbi:MAG TPA: PQQ-dependent sugar dehydrogenase [Thermoanaerobaculia bacterium]|nr:PQQ-dependent sugar dehydrogenase [Thermoanaerobaculia bacterium]
MPRASVAAVATLVLVATTAAAQVGELTLATVASGLGGPVYLTHAGDDRLFVVEREGRIRILRSGVVEATPFLDLRGRFSGGGERGLLSMAFHPDYPRTPWVFVYYTRAPDGAVVISRFGLSADPDRLDAGSEAVLVVQDQPFSNHNGGQLQFGPDGYLYAGLGDGGSANDPLCAAQRVDTLLGKMIRLDVDRNTTAPPFYAIPPDNPFAGPGDPPDEVWASGLRNPWRFSFDRVTGDLWIADVGQGAVEEIDLQPAGSAGGRNWGWKYKEGRTCVSAGEGCPATAVLATGCDDPALDDPVLTYGHDDGNCSVTGGYVYRGAAIPGLAGDYLYGDFCSGRIWRAVAAPSGLAAVDTGLRLPQLTSFGEDGAGELYAMSLDGTVRRLVDAGQADPGTVQWLAGERSFAEGAGVVELSVERSGGDSGLAAVRVTTVAGGGGAEAVEGEDYLLLTERVEWADGEQGAKAIRIELIDDALLEQDEVFRLRLSLAEGGVSLPPPREVEVTVLDDERRTAVCAAGAHTLCLNGGRFRVETTWRDFDDRGGAAGAVALTDDSGSFWFFEPDNVEVVIKVLDACAFSGRYWVFATGLTNLQTGIEVVDTAAGELRRYGSELGVAFAPVLDTAAFATCP